MKKGFALPTVLIVSVVMIMVLAVSVSATTASRQSLLNQYYTQLAQAAGEAGTAYARACLAANGNVPTWSNAAPLTPQTNCSGVVVPSYPSSVTSFKSDPSINNPDIVTSFSVGLPSVDSTGRAVTIPNSGYVNLLRSSTNQVWKTYTQPTFQSAVVPDLCSANQVGAQNGWTNAVSTAGSVPNFGDTSAGWTSIQSGSSIDPGFLFFRKDFNAPSDGTYDVSALADNYGSVSIDNKQILTATSTTSPTNGTVSLTTGCHSVIVRVVNIDVSPSDAKFALSIKKQGSSNASVVSDGSWYVATGNSLGFSQNNYFDYGWATPRDQGIYSASPWTGGPANWLTVSSDYTARWLNSSNYAAGSYPFNQYTYFRTTSPDLLKVSTPTQFKLAVACDNACDVYLDGSVVISNTNWSVPSTATVTLSEGSHTIGIQLYNGGASANASGFLFSMRNATTNQIVLNSNTNFWNGSNTWYSTPQTLNSYDETYIPIPFVTSPFNILLVGGGGSGGGSTGGGGGGGGVLTLSDVPLYLGSYPVTVGAGGATPGNKAQGQNGVNTVFFNYLAFGGGGGGYSTGSAFLPGFIGGSGGGGQNYYGTGIAGTALLAGQGNDGGLLQSFVGTTGGGGAGAAGSRPVVTNGGANGGAGLAVTITGTTVYYGGGGGGAGSTAGSSGSGGTGGGGAGNEVGTAGTANTGGGGGGGWSYASGNGGAGGSGIVIIVYPQSANITATGGTKTSGTVSGVPVWIHTFTSSSTFSITQIGS